MSESSFPESALIAHRVSVLLHGGLEDDRRHWAEEAASHFAHEGPLREVRTPEELGACLRLTRGVVYVPDVLKLGEQAQAALARSLFIQEERPKWVVGVVGSPEAARERGTLREDLHYRLHRALVDLSSPAVREAIELRRRERPVARQPAAAAAKSGATKAKEGSAEKAAARGSAAASAKREAPAKAAPARGGAARSATPKKAAKREPAGTTRSHS